MRHPAGQAELLRWWWRAIPVGVVFAAVVIFAAMRAERSASPSLSSTSSTPSTLSATLLSSRKKGEVELALVGDVMLARNVEDDLKRNERDYTFPFAVVAPLLQKADIASCNLESPLTTQGEALKKNYIFRAKPEAVKGLAYAGFDVVTLANNHILDYGPVSLSDTTASLTAEKIKIIGISTGEAPQTPAIFDVRGVKVAFLAYADPDPKFAYAKEFMQFDPKPAQGTREVIARDIVALKNAADVIVVSMHWGIEYSTEPNPAQIALGHFIIDAGADVIAGHHPHVQQEPEIYNDGLIIFSAGNFVFDQHSRPPTRDSRLYRVFVNKGGFVRAEYLPLTIPKGIWQPTLVPPEQFVPVTKKELGIKN